MIGEWRLQVPLPQAGGPPETRLELDLGFFTPVFMPYWPGELDVVGFELDLAGAK